VSSAIAIGLPAFHVRGLLNLSPPSDDTGGGDSTAPGEDSGDASESLDSAGAGSCAGADAAAARRDRVTMMRKM
jgi:hypothetical protein